MSEDSDDDNLQLLLEATDKQFINDSMFNGVQKRADETPKKPPSLRHKNEDEDQPNWFIKVTPEFRNHISKKLTQLLDDEITYKTSPDSTIKKKKHKDNIRLFKDSPHKIKITAEIQHTVKRPAAKRPITPDFDDLKRIAISGEDILNKKDIKCWSNRSKATVFYYHKDKNGQLTYIEPPFK